MHGGGHRDGPDLPPDCDGDANLAGLVKRGDTEIGMLTAKLMASKEWLSPGNMAIVVTFDENNKEERGLSQQGCCGSDPNSVANFGGGHIVTIVITNHGRHRVVDQTPYNHYSLLRTTEAALGIDKYLGHAADSDKGVVTMMPLFASIGR